MILTQVQGSEALATEVAWRAPENQSSATYQLRGSG